MAATELGSTTTSSTLADVPLRGTDAPGLRSSELAPDADRQGLDRLAKLVDDARFGMLTTRSDSGTLHARPLTTLQARRAERLVLEFMINADSDIAREVIADPQVNVAYANPKKDEWASISGSARLDRSVERKRELWSAMVQAWFPGGPDDAASVLLAVTMDGAEYWAVQDGRLTQTWKMLKAAAAGHTPDLDTEHAKIGSTAEA